MWGKNQKVLKRKVEINDEQSWVGGNINNIVSLNLQYTILLIIITTYINFGS